MPNTSRIVPGANQDVTSRVLTNDYQNPAYAATLALVPLANDTIVNVQQLTGAMTINVTVTNLYIGDKIHFMFAADSTNRTVTFGTGCASTGTITVTASKYGYVDFMFNGTTLVETGRAATV